MTPFEQARAALVRALSSELSPFYRNFYASAGFDAQHLPDNVTEWNRVPLLSKADIMRVPVMERLFMPLEKVGMIRFTSGTTGKGILIMPRRIVPRSSPDALRFKGKALMSFYYYVYPFAKSRGDNPLRIISGDRTALTASAALAAGAGVDTLYGPASVLIAFASHLRAHASHTQIGLLILTAERLSLLHQEALHEWYPGAAIANQYALQECGEIAYALPHLQESVLVEASPDHFIEIMDGNTAHPLDTVIGTVEGELVITSLYPAAFPFIRYRSGDRVRATHMSGRVLLEVLNREEAGQIRIPGGELLLAEFERTIAKLFPKIVADFECIVEEVKSGGAVVTAVTLTLFTTAAGTGSPADAAERIAKELRVSPRRTYADGVARGLYAPLVCEFAPLKPSEQKREHFLDRRR